MKKTLRRLLMFAVAAPLLLAGVFFTHLYLTQEAAIFPGTVLPHDHRFEFDLPFEEVRIPVDGAELSGLHFQQANPRGLIFFLHGNGGNLESWTTNVDYYRRVNYDLFIFDYRGYGKSTGRIQDEKQLYDDVRTAWNTIAPRYEEKPIVIYGRSLGAALAANLATDVMAELLVLVSPFTSIVAMARQQYPYIPEWLVRYPLRTDDIVSRIKMPIVFVHGDADELIPLDHSQRLIELATAKTRLLVIEGAGHNDIHQFKSYVDGLTRELPD